MKKRLLTLAMALSGYCSNAQNTFPPSGNAGIGTTSPDTKLVIQANSSDNLISFWNNVGTKKAYIGTATASGQMIPGSAINDLVIRSENQKIMFSTDAGSTAHMTIGTNGNVGIGTTSPSQALQIGDNSAGAIGLRIAGISVNYDMLTDASTHDLYIKNGGSEFLRFGWLTGYSIFSGNVGIGTTTPDAKLAVKGTIHTQEVKVDMNGWNDYVFDKTYLLPTLSSVKKYIDQNHHLPQIPSEAEIIKNGVNLGEMVKLQTKKIEELTLYLIEKDKQVSDQQRKTEQQDARIAALEKALEKLTNK